MKFEEAFRQSPIIAILRGIRPNEVVAVCEALWAAGFRVVEVPLNSPDPLKSIGLLSDALGDRLAIGGGTVLKADWVDAIDAAGGTIIVAPNTNPAVIQRCLDLGLVPIPGIATPTEAFAAYDTGARFLKLFPAASLGSSFLRQLKAVLPRDAIPIAVGGVSESNLDEWRSAGAEGFGIGSEIYRPGQSPEDTLRAASRLIGAIKASH